MPDNKSTLVRKIDFGPVWNGSGARGFFGEGYWYHLWFKILFWWWPWLDRCTIVAKTTTLHQHAGNMPLREDGITPRELKPRSIWISLKSFWRGYALNAAGLSGPGVRFLLNQGKWQKRTKPFLISFMSIAKTKEERLAELRQFVQILASYLPQFHAPVGLQLNFSCPSVGLNPQELIAEVEEALTIAASLNIPLVPKFNILIPVALAKAISEHPFCDAICVSNTIPWEQIPPNTRRRLFGQRQSPLANMGGGGLSGRPLLPWVVSWVARAREIGITIPINAGGGILGPKNAATLFAAGANSISIASVFFLRPWQVARIIKAATRRLLQ